MMPQAADFPIDIVPAADNGLREPSQIMADKPVPVNRERIGLTIGRLSVANLRRVDSALAFAIGLAD